MTDEDIQERLDRLESLVEQQQTTIEQQQETIDEQREQLAAASTAASHPLLVADGGDVKVVGNIDANEGIGVRGTATGDGKSVGVRGDTTSVNGRGVMGFATSEDYDHDPFTEAAAGVTGVTNRSSADDGIEEAAGVSGRATAETGFAMGVAGVNEAPGGIGVLGNDDSGSGHGLFSLGDSAIWGDQNITGALSFSDGTPQWTAGPVAKGYIFHETIENAVNVNNVIWFGDEEHRYYLVELDGIDYDYEKYVTAVTCHDTDYPVPIVVSAEYQDKNHMLVEFDDADPHPFSFATYKLPDGMETTAEVESREDTTFSDGDHHTVERHEPPEIQESTTED